MKAKVYKNRCNGCTICNITCPEVFLIGEDGKATVNEEDIPKDIELTCIEAADECPSNAIFLEKAAGKYASSVLVGCK